MVKELLGSLLCLTIHCAHNHSLVRLPIQYDSPEGSCKNERDNREIFFTLHIDGYGWMQNRVCKRADQFIGQGAGRVFDIDTLAPMGRHIAARGSHGMPVDHRNRRSDSVPLEIMGDYIPYCVYDTAGDEGEYLLNTLV